MSILEAMASGVPIVSTAVGGVPELLGSGRFGLLVPPGEVQSLAAAIQDLFNIHDRASQARVDQGRAHCREHYSVEAMTTAYETVYESASGAAIG